MYLFVMKVCFESSLKGWHYLISRVLFSSKAVALVCAFMLGFGDASFNTQVNFIFISVRCLSKSQNI